MKSTMTPITERLLLVCVLLLVANCSSLARKVLPSTCSHDAHTFRCVKYVTNYDGDTITFNIDDVHPLLGHNISARLLGVDTPEIKGKGACEREAAKKAQILVEEMLKNAKRIDLVEISRDKYFRIDANVIADGKSVADILTEMKLAYPYKGGTKVQRDWCNP